METKKFKIQKTERTKGGFNDTRTVLTAAGITAVGGAAAGAGFAAMAGRKEDSAESKETEEQASQVNTETVEEQQSQQEQVSSQPTQQQPASSDEYQPTEGGQQMQTNQSTTQNATDGDAVPNDVAQALADEVDRGDLDTPNVLTIEEFGVVSGPDGTEMAVAIVHSPDGTQYFLADIDGDGVFSDVYDLSGNYIGAAEGNLTASDLQMMQDPTGGYLAMGEEPIGDDPVDGIINTGEGKPVNDTQNMAQQTTAGSNVETDVEGESISDEDLLALLTEDLAEPETNGERLVSESKLEVDEAEEETENECNEEYNDEDDYGYEE